MFAMVALAGSVVPEPLARPAIEDVGNMIEVLLPDVTQ